MFSTTRMPDYFIQFFLEILHPKRGFFFLHIFKHLFSTLIILQIESQKISMIEVALLIKELKFKITKRNDEIFIHLVVRNLISALDKTGMKCADEFNSNSTKFYNNCIDYLNQWDQAFKDVEVMEWVHLRKLPSWNSVERNLIYVMEIRNKTDVNDDELVDEFSFVKNYLTSGKLNEWKPVKKL
uniref:Uncharacterized protein n=1 Tax=Bactrocera latifrons TaxID=174628 RepID=A0A0K8VA12_BACLA